MKKSKDLLKEKAKEVPTLKDTLSEEDAHTAEEENYNKPAMEINEKVWAMIFMILMQG